VSDFLLDSDCLIDYLAGFASTVQFIDALFDGGDRLFTSDVVVAELYTGLSSQQEPAAARLLARLGYLSTSLAAARQAGAWRDASARRGVALSTTDCLIAATAQEHGAVVVTGNVRHFQMQGVSIVPLPRVQR
jgi:predicted nucleic acid-binding protein